MQHSDLGASRRRLRVRRKRPGRRRDQRVKLASPHLGSQAQTTAFASKHEEQSGQGRQMRYGDVHPHGHLIATIEIFTGMCFLAVMTGLIFARFSRPRARFVRQKPRDHTPRRATNPDDPDGERTTQHDISG
jgi:hypothetical protein